MSDGRRDSVVGRATRYSVDGSNPDVGKTFTLLRTCPDRPWGPPSLLNNGYRDSFPGVKQLGRDDHRPPSSAEIQHTYTVPSWHLTGITLRLDLSDKEQLQIFATDIPLHSRSAKVGCWPHYKRGRNVRLNSPRHTSYNVMISELSVCVNTCKIFCHVKPFIKTPSANACKQTEVSSL